MYGGSTRRAYTAQIAVILLLAATTSGSGALARRTKCKSAGLILATMLATPYAFNYDSVLLGAAIAFLVADGFEARLCALRNLGARAALGDAADQPRGDRAVAHARRAARADAAVRDAHRHACVAKDAAPRLAHAV